MDFNNEFLMRRSGNNNQVPERWDTGSIPPTDATFHTDHHCLQDNANTNNQNFFNNANSNMNMNMVSPALGRMLRAGFTSFQVSSPWKIFFHEKFRTHQITFYALQIERLASSPLVSEAVSSCLLFALCRSSEAAEDGASGQAVRRIIR